MGTEATKVQELFVETLALWTEAGQRVLGDVVELGAAAARESVRLSGELGRTALEALREHQAAALRWQSSWTPGTDPAAWYRRAALEAVNGAERSFKLAERNAQAIARSVDRMQTTAEQTARSIQDTVAGTVSKLREVCAAG